MTARERNQTILSRVFLILGSVVAALFGLEAAFSPAAAQKETFERRKPHLNVGTVGSGGSSPSQKTCCGEVNSGASVDADKEPAQQIQDDDEADRRERR